MNVTTNQPVPNTLAEHPDFSVPPKLAAEIDELITHYPQKRSASLMVLHAIQDQFGWISRQAAEWTAAKLELQPINILELVTFYPMFRRQPMGKNQFKVCRTLSCALGGVVSANGRPVLELLALARAALALRERFLLPRLIADELRLYGALLRT